MVNHVLGCSGAFLVILLSHLSCFFGVCFCKSLLLDLPFGFDCCPVPTCAGFRVAKNLKLFLWWNGGIQIFLFVWQRDETKDQILSCLSSCDLLWGASASVFSLISFPPFYESSSVDVVFFAERSGRWTLVFLLHTSMVVWGKMLRGYTTKKKNDSVLVLLLYFRHDPKDVRT